MYYAIIGDIKDSRKIKNRFEVQEKLEEVLEEINNEFDEIISAKFIMTLGDEFQGLLCSTRQLIKIIEKIKLKMYPTQIRFGIGFGDINTKINREMAIGADGTAYHHARRMISEIKKSEKSKMTGQSSIRVSGDEKKSILELMNNTFCLWTFIQKKWTAKQIRIILLNIQTNNNQRETAKKLGIVQSTVQRSLKSSGFYSYLETKSTLEVILEEEWG